MDDRVGVLQARLHDARRRLHARVNVLDQAQHRIRFRRRQRGEQVARFQLEEYPDPAGLGQSHRIMQRRGFRHPNRVVTDRQTGRLFEREGAAAGARRHDHRLSRLQLAGDRRAERLGAVGGTDHVYECRTGERRVDVVARIRDIREALEAALRMDALLSGDRGDVVRELRKIEQPHLVAVRGAIERDRGSARACSQYRNLHLVIPRRRAAQQRQSLHMLLRKTTNR